MARPRYQITEYDWLDCLDWIDHQINQPHWLEQADHPIHTLGIAKIQRHLSQWRTAQYPTKTALKHAQSILEQVFTIDDWGRLRKALSARKRRRREQRIEQKSVNITLTPNAHRMIIEYRNLTGCQTISEAIEHALNDVLREAAENAEQVLSERVMQQLMCLKASEIVEVVAKYLDIAAQRRTLANSCKIAFQLFSKRPGRDSLKLLCDRFCEDLIWNQVHLNISYDSLSLFDQVAIENSHGQELE
jgi:hypothetical protein